MKVYIVAEVEPIDAGIENDYLIADALAQTLGGEVGTMLFEAEDDDGERQRRAIYRLTHIAGYPGDVDDISASGGQIMYPVDQLAGEVEGLYLPAKRWQP